MNNKKDKRELSLTQKVKVKELKAKVAESKRVKKLGNENTSSRKAEIKLIKKENKTPKGETQISNSPGNIIDVKNLTKTYVRGSTAFDALKNVSLTIKKGEFVVILGASGSGKTTLLNVLSGLDRSTSGQIIVGNTNISALKNAELTTFRRNNIGFVFQSYNLLLELNAMDNARLGQKLQMDANKRLDLDELFEKVGLGDQKKRSINELSGGQLQRVSIIRALAKNPSIIFADEPTGALDSKTSVKVLELFKEINKKYGTTIIFVTHDETIKTLADRLIYVKDGEVNVETK